MGGLEFFTLGAVSAASSRLAPVNSRFHPSDASGREHGICIDRQRLLAKRILGFVGKLNILGVHGPIAKALRFVRLRCQNTDRGPESAMIQ